MSSRSRRPAVWGSRSFPLCRLPGGPEHGLQGQGPRKWSPFTPTPGSQHKGALARGDLVSVRVWWGRIGDP